MKLSPLMLIVWLPAAVMAQQREYVISSFLTPGPKAPNTHYIGEAWLTPLIQADSTTTYNVTHANFKANSTLDWHKHASPQVLIILEGAGYYQERGKAPVILKKGDVVKCAKDTEHWHASTKESDVSYLAIYGGAQPTTWTEKLTQEYYDSVAQQLSGHKK